MSSCNAQEIKDSPHHCREVFLHEDTYSWVKRGAYILDYVGWAPESALRNARNMPRTLPPSPMRGLHFGRYRGFQETGECPEHFRRVEINTSILRLDEIAATSDVAVFEYKEARRGLMSHGRMFLDNIEYLEDVAVLQPLRILRRSRGTKGGTSHISGSKNNRRTPKSLFRTKKMVGGGFTGPTIYGGKPIGAWHV